MQLEDISLSEVYGVFFMLVREINRQKILLVITRKPFGKRICRFLQPHAVKCYSRR
jgi:hypothetical protein